MNNQLNLQPSTSTEATLPAPRRRGFGNKNSQELLGLVGIYALLFIYLSFASPVFLLPSNLMNTLVAISVIGIVGIAMTMVIVSGGLDLSVGSVVGLTGVLVAQFSHRMPIGAAVLLAVLCGVMIGIVNGLAITRVGINPLITTLGTLSIARGLSLVFSNGSTQSIDSQSFAFLGQGRILGIPFLVIVFLVLCVIAAWVMRATVFGRSIYAIGGNAQASRLAGLPVLRLQLAVYILSSLSAAVGGLFLASQLGAGSANAAVGLELDVITAVILGGTSLTGGKGTIAGTLLGGLILGTLNNGLTLLSVNSYYQDIASGAVLLLAVAVDQLRMRLAQK